MRLGRETLAAAMPLIVVEDLRKAYRVAERRPGAWGAVAGLVRPRYRAVDALAGVSFSLDRGDLVGYIGPNGAGKSTTVKILAGILVPDSGRCEVDGRVPWRERVAHVRRLGVVFGQRTQLLWDLPVIDSFELLRDIYRVGAADHARARDELVAMLDLAPLLDTPVRQLSLGQRMRCDLAAALGQAFFQLMPFSTNPDPEVRELIRTGAVGYELARPLDLHSLWLARALVARVAPTALRAVPMFALAVPLLGMSLPPSLAAAGAWAVAMAFAAALVAVFATAVTSTMLWTTSGDGISRIVPSVVLIASGMVVPLPLFPSWMQPWLDALPFRGMVDAPFRLYLGHLPAAALPGVLLHQALWTAAFVALGRAFVARGLRRLVVQGG